jgi:isopentenyl-diphosphate delta-isomerase
MHSAHPLKELAPVSFLGKSLRAPIWVSSMTGGTREAGTINRNLARACNEFGMGMGLGSCRILLEHPEYLDDFNMRPVIGSDLPLYANIGIAQVEEMLLSRSTGKLTELVGRLEADGLIIHVNPVQEWLQPEGDRITRSPLDILEEFIAIAGMPLMVKEVGQGMGPESLRRLMKLPLAAIEFAAYGGTNFAALELARQSPENQQLFSPLAAIGHPADEMLATVNAAVSSGDPYSCSHVIISGGIRSFLDGHYYISKSLLPAVYGQASAFLRFARGDYRELQTYVAGQVNGLKFARSFLKIRTQ